MKKLLSILFLLCPAVMQAQNTSGYTFEYGQVNAFELKETQYADDPQAEAAVIYEKGLYRFLPFETVSMDGLELIMTVRKKIKIYNEAGFDYATVEIPYYYPVLTTKPEEVTIVGATYNLEGGHIIRTELPQANIYTEKVSDELYVKKVAFPNVRVGSVIEFEYTIRTIHYFRMRTWAFQSEIPVHRSELVYRATPFYDYAFIARGITEFDEHKTVEVEGDMRFIRVTYHEMDNIFVMKNMPAFRDEEFLLNTKDYVPNINFQLANYRSWRTGAKVEVISTWPVLCSDLLQDADFGKYVNASETASKTILPEIGLQGKSDLEKFEAVCKYVKQKYVWNGGEGKYAEKRLSEFLKDKTGNAANINLFMIGLMRAAGLEAYPVALSTQENGMIYKDFPFLHLLNYAVAMVQIDGEYYFADASEPLTRYDELPERCTNVEGLVIKKKNPEWVELLQNEESVDSKDIRIKILPAEGKQVVEMTQTLSGKAALKLRKKYNGDVEKLKDEYKDREGMSIREIETENFHNTSEPFVVNMEYDLSTGPAESEPDKIYFNPLLHLAPDSAPFKQAQRTHPVNLVFSSINNYTAEIEIPKGYSVEYLPGDFLGSSGIMNILYKYSVDGNKIRLTAGFAMRDFYETNEYTRLKTMYEDMVRAFSGVIILKKD